jgi:hypothetical protein
VRLKPHAPSGKAKEELLINLTGKAKEGLLINLKKPGACRAFSIHRISIET